MAESDLRNQILSLHSRGDVRLFRANAGFAWQGKVVQHDRVHLVLENPRPIRLGVEGISDLIGFSPVVIERAQLAVYTAIELKTGRQKPTPAQIAFIETVLRLGGRAGVARSVADAEHILLTPPGTSRTLK